MIDLVGCSKPAAHAQKAFYHNHNNNHHCHGYYYYHFYRIGTRKHNLLKPPSSRSNASAGLVGISTLDDTCDLTNLKLRSNNIIIILLHQDPIDGPKKFGADHSLTEISDDFFEGIAPFSTQNLFGESGDDARKDLASFCSYDHIRLDLLMIVFL